MQKAICKVQNENDVQSAHLVVLVASEGKSHNERNGSTGGGSKFLLVIV